MDAGRWTLDAGPSTPYYKLTGELKIAYSRISELADLLKDFMNNYKHSGQKFGEICLKSGVKLT